MRLKNIPKEKPLDIYTEIDEILSNNLIVTTLFLEQLMYTFKKKTTLEFTLIESNSKFQILKFMGHVNTVNNKDTIISMICKYSRMLLSQPKSIKFVD